MILLMVASFSSCATVLKGDMEGVRLNSEPPAARVYINGEYYGRTPLEIELKCYESYTIEFVKEGHERVVRRITNRIGAGYVVLDVVCGFVPVVIDALTGSWYKLNQHYVNVILEKQQP
jgi:hypothetical protein